MAIMNPWHVESIQEFVFLNCPECIYKSKEEDAFQQHAMQNHPQSSVLFQPSTTEQEITVSNVIISEDGTTAEIIPLEYYVTEAPTTFNGETVIAETTQIVTAESADMIPENATVIEENLDPKDIVIKVKDEKVAHVTDENVAPFIGKPFEANAAKIPSQSGYKKGQREIKKNSVQALINVLEELSEDQKFSCIVCKQSFKSNKMMKEHTLKEHGDKEGNIKCLHCNKTLPSDGELRKHIRARHYYQQCHLCDKVVQLHILKRHLESVHGDRSKKKHKCNLCDFTTHSGRYLTDHKYNVHTVKGQQYLQASKSHECSQCGATFASKLSLEQHLEIFHELGFSQEKNYHCSECEQTFAGPNLLLSHTQSVHNSIPTTLLRFAKHACNVCNVTYMSKAGLQRHNHQKHPKSKMVNGKKGSKGQKKCQHCGRDFRTATLCLEHVKTVHENDTPYQCDSCPRKFCTQYLLKSHVSTVHSKAICDLCGQLQYNKFYLKRHKASVHGLIPPGSFKCRFCTEWFKYKCNLEKHIDSKHQS